MQKNIYTIRFNRNGETLAKTCDNAIDALVTVQNLLFLGTREEDITVQSIVNYEVHTLNAKYFKCLFEGDIISNEALYPHRNDIYLRFIYAGTDGSVSEPVLARVVFPETKLAQKRAAYDYRTEVQKMARECSVSRKENDLRGIINELLIRKKRPFSIVDKLPDKVGDAFATFVMT